MEELEKSNGFLHKQILINSIRCDEIREVFNKELVTKEKTKNGYKKIDEGLSL